jgi:hypothetical protein
MKKPLIILAAFISIPGLFSLGCGGDDGKGSTFAPSDTTQNMSGSMPEIEWERTYGGPEGDRAACVQQTTDGGFIIIGHTRSFSQWNEASGFDWNIWLVKLDQNGEEEWNKVFGSDDDDKGRYVEETSDGGYLIVGETYSSKLAHRDIWLIKTDRTGIEEWNRTLGGEKGDGATWAQKTSDGGYVLIGYTESYGAGQRDCWLIKINELGEKQWDRTFGSAGYDEGIAVIQTSDRGYVLLGGTRVDEDSTQDEDFWITKTDTKGNAEWSRTFDNSGGAVCVKETFDGGYLAVGAIGSYEEESFDSYITKLDQHGEEEWSTTFGTGDNDMANFVQLASNGGYIIGGVTIKMSSVWGDASPWFVKIGEAGEEEWSTSFSLAENEYVNFMDQTRDGGYIMIGGRIVPKDDPKWEWQTDFKVIKLRLESQ